MIVQYETKSLEFSLFKTFVFGGHKWQDAYQKRNGRETWQKTETVCKAKALLVYYVELHQSRERRTFSNASMQEEIT